MFQVGRFQDNSCNLSTCSMQTCNLKRLTCNLIPMLDILYCDNHLLFINKPAGMLSQADSTGDADALSLAKAWIKKEFDKPGAVFLGLVHRLDRPASGVMVFARTSKAARRLVQQFKERTVEKRYLALAHSRCESKGVLENFLRKEKGRVKIVERDHAGAQHARLRFNCIAFRKNTSLVEIALETGRKHQIRAQFAASGHPLLGDFRYGSQMPFDGKNLALHSYHLSLTHPTRGEKITQIAAPGAEWNVLFKKEIDTLISNSLP